MWNVIIIFKDKKIITINYSQDSYINLYNNCDNNNNIKFVKILFNSEAYNKDIPLK